MGQSGPNPNGVRLHGAKWTLWTFPVCSVQYSMARAGLTSPWCFVTNIEHRLTILEVNYFGRCAPAQ